MNGLVFTLILFTFKSTWQLRRTPLATRLVTLTIVFFSPANQYPPGLYNFWPVPSPDKWGGLPCHLEYVNNISVKTIPFINFT